MFVQMWCILALSTLTIWAPVCSSPMPRKMSSVRSHWQWTPRRCGRSWMLQRGTTSSSWRWGWSYQIHDITGTLQFEWIKNRGSMWLVSLVEMQVSMKHPYCPPFIGGLVQILPRISGDKTTTRPGGSGWGEVAEGRLLRSSGQCTEVSR